MRIVKYLIIGLAFIFFASAGNAQEWDEMILVIWLQFPPPTSTGFFNPSFCLADSILYSDSYFRQMPDSDTPKIFACHLDSIEYNQYFWSDQIYAPYPLNMEGTFSATPYLTPTGDSIFFSSNRSGTFGGMDIWLSVRTDDVWGEPVNLGDSINTEADELGPCFSSQADILFFDRIQVESREYYKIFKSKFINGVFQVAEILPEIINLPTYNTYGPYYDDFEEALYFTNQTDGLVDRPLMKSILVNDQWQTPQPLSENVNGNPYGTGIVITENAFMSHDRTLLFYNKIHLSLDYWSKLYFSERLGNSIEDNSIDLPSASENIHVYPNPSNSGFKIDLSSIGERGELKIYNIQGQLIKYIYVSEYKQTVEWNNINNKKSSIASGIYFAVFHTKTRHYNQKLLLLK